MEKRELHYSWPRTPREPADYVINKVNSGNPPPGVVVVQLYMHIVSYRLSIYTVVKITSFGHTTPHTPAIIYEKPTKTEAR